MNRISRAIIWVSIITVVAGAVGGLFLRTLAREYFGVEEIIPPPAIHLRADTLFQLGPISVTNTLISSWLATFSLAGLMGLAMGPPIRTLKWLHYATVALLEFLLELFKRVAGEKWSPVTFSFIASLFLFIIANAWVTILPIYGPIRLDLGGEIGGVPLLRAAGTDINMPLALAIIAGIFVEVHAFRAQGIIYLREFFPYHTFVRRGLVAGIGALYLAFLHNLSQATRLLSFTFRLFGALTAGELLRIIVSFVAPLILVIPFYGLEILLGLLQAFVFAGLTLALMVAAEGKNDSPAGNRG